MSREADAHGGDVHDEGGRTRGEPTGAPCPYPDYEPTQHAPGDLPNTGEDATGVEARVWDALYEVEDPEMPVSIVDLGLVYGVEVHDGTAVVEMTLTYSGCPAREMLTTDVEDAAAAVDGVDDATIVLVYSPPWTVEMVTPTGRDALREFGLSVPEVDDEADADREAAEP